MLGLQRAIDRGDRQAAPRSEFLRVGKDYVASARRLNNAVIEIFAPQP